MLSERGPKPLSLQDAKDAIGIGEALPIVEPEGLKVHRVVFVGLFDEVRTRCGRIIDDDVLSLLAAARALSAPLPCLNCERSERRNP